MAIKPKLQSLLASANDVTGQERDNLTDAVQDLVDGYGTSNPIELSLRDASSNYRGIYISNGNGFVGTNSRNYVWGTLYKSDKSSFVFNPASANSNFRVVFKIKTPPAFYTDRWPVAWTPLPVSTRGVGTECLISRLGDSTHGKIYVRSRDANLKEILGGVPCLASTWYYVCIYQTLTSSIISVYSEDGVLLGCVPFISSGFSSCNTAMTIGGISGTQDDWDGSIDIAESFFEIDGVCVWGKTNSRTANMGKFDFANPASFTKVDWLESDGGQYIDTKILPQQNLQWNIKIGANSNLDNFSVGWGSSGGAEACFVTASNADYRYSFSGNYTSHTVPIAKDENLHIFSLKNGSQKFDGVEYSTDDTLRNTATTGQTIILFAGNWKWESPTRQNCKCRIDYSEMLLNNVPSQNLISVYHTETGLLGMFDAVNNQFHMNAGTGDFTKPSDTSGEKNLAEYLASLT